MAHQHDHDCIMIQSWLAHRGGYREAARPSLVRYRRRLPAYERITDQVPAMARHPDHQIASWLHRDCLSWWLTEDAPERRPARFSPRRLYREAAHTSLTHALRAQTVSLHTHHSG